VHAEEYCWAITQAAAWALKVQCAGVWISARRPDMYI
jgi:hypothetical protein